MTARHCVHCNIVIESDSPEGLCLKCLAEAGMSRDKSAPSEGATIGDSIDVIADSKKQIDGLINNQTIRRFGDYELLEEIARAGLANLCITPAPAASSARRSAPMGE